MYPVKKIYKIILLSNDICLYICINIYLYIFRNIYIYDSNNTYLSVQIVMNVGNNVIRVHHKLFLLFLSLADVLV